MARVFQSKIVKDKKGLVLVIPDELAEHMGLKVGTDVLVRVKDQRTLIVELI